MTTPAKFCYVALDRQLRKKNDDIIFGQSITVTTVIRQPSTTKTGVNYATFNNSWIYRFFVPADLYSALIRQAGSLIFGSFSSFGSFSEL